MSAPGSGRAEQAAPRERHIRVVKTARYWVLGGEEGGEEQGGEEQGGGVPTWFVLHGYRQLARRFLRRFEGLGAGLRIVAPEALSRFYVGREEGRHGPESVVGATWMTREEREHEIRDYVEYLDAVADEVLGTDPGDAFVGVLGFSQGVATASRWVTLGRVRPRRVVLWADYLPPDLDMARASVALGRAELVLVRGDSDPSRKERLEAAEGGRLADAGIVHRRVPYAGGHELEPDTLARLLAV